MEEVGLEAGGRLFECIDDKGAVDIVTPAKEFTRGQVCVGDTPAGIINDHSVRDSAHDIFFLMRVAVGGFGVEIGLAEETRIVNREARLLGKAFQQGNLFSGKTAGAAMVDFNGA